MNIRYRYKNRSSHEKSAIPQCGFRSCGYLPQTVGQTPERNRKSKKEKGYIDFIFSISKQNNRAYKNAHYKIKKCRKSVITHIKKLPRLIMHVLYIISQGKTTFILNFLCSNNCMNL